MNFVAGNNMMRLRDESRLMGCEPPKWGERSERTVEDAARNRGPPGLPSPSGTPNGVREQHLTHLPQIPQIFFSYEFLRIFQLGEACLSQFFYERFFLSREIR